MIISWKMTKIKDREFWMSKNKEISNLWQLY